MATENITNTSTPSPYSPTALQSRDAQQAASRRVQNTKTEQHQATQNKREAQAQEQRAQDRLNRARTEEVQSRQRVSEAQAEQQRVASQRIDVVV